MEPSVQTQVPGTLCSQTPPAPTPQKSSKKIILIIALIVSIPVIILVIWLSVVGLTVYRGVGNHIDNSPSNPKNISPLKAYTGMQLEARDAKRKADVDALAKALENYYGTENPNEYSGIKGEWFIGGVIPKDSFKDEYYQGTPLQSVSTFTICAILDTQTTPYCVKSLH